MICERVDGLRYKQDNSHCECLYDAFTPPPAVFSADPLYSSLVGDLEDRLAKGFGYGARLLSELSDNC